MDNATASLQCYAQEINDQMHKLKTDIKDRKKSKQEKETKKQNLEKQIRDLQLTLQIVKEGINGDENFIKDTEVRLEGCSRSYNQVIYNTQQIMNAVRSQDKFDAEKFMNTRNNTEGLNEFQPRRTSTMVVESDEIPSSLGTSFTQVDTRSNEVGRETVIDNGDADHTIHIDLEDLDDSF